MEPPQRKYLSEFAVHLCSAGWIIITPTELASGNSPGPEQSELISKCHIYAICRRPASFFDPDTFAYDGSHVRGHIVYQMKGSKTSVAFKLPFSLTDGATDLRLTSYPHREFETFDKAGTAIRYLPAWKLSVTGVIIDKNLRDLEVLYVGQAYADGQRTALDRLRSHSTLQKILANLHYHQPEDEVLLLGFEYASYRMITLFDGVAKEAIRDERDEKRFRSLLDHPLSERQKICLAEAGLIRFFQPKYNEVYKESFPASNLRILNTCYDLDFLALVVEINTEDFAVSLCSPSVAPASHHIAKFDLIDPTIRRSFFTLSTHGGSTSEMPGVIPPSR